MNRTDLNCSPDITNKYYTSPHLRRFFFPLAVLNCIIDGCSPITSVGGSALLLVAVIKFPQLREVPSNLLLASQAVSDFLIGLLIQPLITARHISFVLGDCLLAQSNFLKAFASYWTHALLFSSCLNICLITVDRYICIAHSLRYQTLVTEERVIRAIIASWSFSLVFASVQVVPFLPGSTVLRSTVRPFSVIPPTLLVLITFVCYFKMTKIARRHERQIRAQINQFLAPTEQDFQSTKTTLLMVGVTLLFCLPMVCVVIVLYASNNFELLEAVIPFVATFACLNPSINPLVYYARSRKIRRYVWKVLKCELN
ncbi:trace amine-associated receptor 5-like [Oculina patagonica]